MFQSVLTYSVQFYKNVTAAYSSATITQSKNSQRELRLSFAFSNSQTVSNCTLINDGATFAWGIVIQNMYSELDPEHSVAGFSCLEFLKQSEVFATSLIVET